MESKSDLSRRDFVKTTGSAVVGATLVGPRAVSAQRDKKIRLALVGTGSRGSGMWGRTVLRNYGDLVEYVGLCDINPGRVAFIRDELGLECPVYTDFEQMMRKTRPERVIVTTVDSTHDEYIVKALDMGADVITEKPMTTDEVKCQNILDAEKRSGRKVTVTFNYRYSPLTTKIKTLVSSGEIGRVTSVDFNWYLNTSHGAAYFRRWHGLREKSGTLLVHKSTHHFDLLNWWLDSEPLEVFGNGALEFYGGNGPFRSTHCRACPHTGECSFYWDIERSGRRNYNGADEHEQVRNKTWYEKLYVDHEHLDGYHRDGCVYREEIDIYDKMAVQIKYANNVQVSYSLTTYSPYEGYRIALNGTEGRLEGWIQSRQPWPRADHHELRLTRNFRKSEIIEVPKGRGGHDGGDGMMMNRIFKDSAAPDPYGHAAGARDGTMSILIGIGARKSIEEGRKIRIADLTSLEPREKRSG